MAKTHKLSLTGSTARRPHNWQMYYDRATRAWWAYEIDAEGNQIGDAVSAYTREECKEAAASEASARYKVRAQPLLDCLAHGRKLAKEMGLIS
jgi:phage terminase large subunit-like protein